ncbi:hypothetical protein PMKS-002070 [Pichia membranifaciens]|uniref:Uncharacterized protein n=1 Tax=Pichia membranifaciens TaxID=4926 RepID=A0A1Q2YGF9_9ASCO|nr:hypothetical protein PMKS-002070 [Pichia membranifaciens]
MNFRYSFHMRLFNKPASVTVLAGLTSALRLDLESHVETKTWKTTVTTYTATLNTTQLSLCFNDAVSTDFGLYAFNDTEWKGKLVVALNQIEKNMSGFFVCLQQQDLQSALEYYNDKPPEDAVQIYDEIFTWTGVDRPSRLHVFL